MNKDNIIYRPLLPEDACEMHKTDLECFSVPWSEQTFFNEANNPLACYIVAQADDEIAGYIGFLKVLDEGQITNVAVKEKHRQKKIASTLLNKAIQSAKDYELSILNLEVRDSNFAAISLYKKYGFYEIGRRKNYYKNPTEDAILMELKIREE